MAIVLESPEFAKLYGQAAIVYGQAQRAKEEYRVAQETASKLLDVKLQQDFAVFQNNLTLERMKFGEQLDFEKEKRSEIWDLEKMELRSRSDFAIQEQKRLQTLQEYDQGMKYIAEKIADGTLPPEKRGELEFNLYMKKVMDINIPQTKTDPMDLLLSQYLQPPTGAPTAKSPAMKLGQPVIPQATPTTSSYNVGQTINRGGKNYKVTGFDVDGTPFVSQI